MGCKVSFLLDPSLYFVYYILLKDPLRYDSLFYVVYLISVLKHGLVYVKSQRPNKMSFRKEGVWKEDETVLRAEI